MTKFLLAFLIAISTALPALAAQAGDESAYARVMRTHTLRCGYLLYEPFFSKDVNTGQLSGLIFDYVNEVATRVGLTVDWAAEINFDQVVPALDAGRIDAFCVPATPNEVWEKVLGFAGDLGALPYYAYVRNDSAITADRLQTAKIAVVDGYALTEIAKHAFPQATFNSLPQTTSAAEMYDQLRFGKADAHVNEGISAQNYMTNNPGVIRRFSDTPLVAMRMFLVTPKSDAEMARAFDEQFSASLPENLAIMRELRTRYNLPDNTLILPDTCVPAVINNGWKVCATHPPAP